MKMIDPNSCVKFCVLCLIFICESSATQARDADCKRIHSQPELSLSDMAGEWYGIEILEHVKANKERPAANSCIKVQIKEVSPSEVELIWREGRDFEVVYKFVVDKPQSRGVWTSQGSQKVTADHFKYVQFAGNVFVLKASEANIVLTFCSEPQILYSLVLSKRFNMNETELASIHGMVSRFGVPPPVGAKTFCKNRAAVYAESAALTLVLCLISFFIVTLRER